MALQSMKIDKKDMPKPEPIGSEDYGYGLSIHLEASQVEKLGLTNCEPGEKLKLDAIGEVRSVHISKDKGSNHYSMTIQITDMDAVKKASNETADALYGS